MALSAQLANRFIPGGMNLYQEQLHREAADPKFDLCFGQLGGTNCLSMVCEGLLLTEAARAEAAGVTIEEVRGLPPPPAILMPGPYEQADLEVQMGMTNYRSTAGLKKTEVHEMLLAKGAYLLCQMDSKSSSKEVRDRRRAAQMCRPTNSFAAAAETKTVLVPGPKTDTYDIPGLLEPVIRPVARLQAVRPDPPEYALEMRSEGKRRIRTQRHQSSAPRPYGQSAPVRAYCELPIILRDEGVVNQFEDGHEIASFRSQLYHDKWIR